MNSSSFAGAVARGFAWGCALFTASVVLTSLWTGRQPADATAVLLAIAAPVTLLWLLHKARLL